MPRKINADAEKIDKEVCASSECVECGHRGMRYIPKFTPTGGYAPVAKCPRCKAEVEF